MPWVTLFGMRWIPGSSMCERGLSCPRRTFGPFGHQKGFSYRKREGQLPGPYAMERPAQSRRDPAEADLGGPLARAETGQAPAGGAWP